MERSPVYGVLVARCCAGAVLCAGKAAGDASRIVRNRAQTQRDRLKHMTKLMHHDYTSGEPARAIRHGFVAD